MAQDVIPSNASEYGLTITSNIAVTGNTVDFTTPVAKALSTNPDVVVSLVETHSNALVATQLRRDGFQGRILSSASASSGYLKPADTAAKGVFWPTDFNPQEDHPSTQTFVHDYKRKYDGQLPLNYAAEAHDAMWMIARGLKTARSADRAELNRGLDTIAQRGFTGAMGHLHFKNHDLRIHGILVKWNGTKPVLMTPGGA